MGYDIHLVKPEIDGREADEVSEREWQSFQKKHAAVDYVYYSGGKISCKNPSAEQVVALAKIAYSQGWRLRGDDGEYYDDSGQVIAEEAPRQGLFGRIKNIFAERRAARDLAAEMESVESVFKVGDRVKSIHRSGGVVIKVDKAGNSGLGQIEVRFPDGAVISGIFPDGGFEREG
jgi:hypothetical protein